MAEELHHYDNFFYSCEPESSLLFLLSRAVIEACLDGEETASPGLLGWAGFLLCSPTPLHIPPPGPVFLHVALNSPTDKYTQYINKMEVLQPSFKA